MSKAAPTKHLSGTKAQFEHAFSDVAQEIGFFARNWNMLHENMGMLFAGVLTQNASMAVPYAIWHEIDSDRLQRIILRSAAKAWALTQGVDGKAIADEIAWLVSEADKLSDSRNTALHAPLLILMDTATSDFSVEAHHWFGNPRAKKLQEKDLIVEINRNREWAYALNRYAVVIHTVFGKGPPILIRPVKATSAPPKTRKSAAKPEGWPTSIISRNDEA